MTQIIARRETFQKCSLLPEPNRRTRWPRHFGRQPLHIWPWSSQSTSDVEKEKPLYFILQECISYNFAMLSTWQKQYPSMNERIVNSTPLGGLGREKHHPREASHLKFFWYNFNISPKVLPHIQIACMVKTIFFVCDDKGIIKQLQWNEFKATVSDLEFQWVNAN